MDLETSKIMRKLYEKHYKGMVAIAYGVVKNYDTAEDMVQKSFENLIKKGGSLKNLKFHEVQALIRTIIIHTSINEVKRKENETIKTAEIETFVKETTPDILDFIINMEKRNEILELLDKLSPEEKGIFILRSYYEWSYEEIATMFHVKPSTLRKKYERIRKKALKIFRRSEVDE